jgi:hypothetical protein
MTKFSKYFFLILFISALTTSASAQVRFDVIPNPYTGAGLSISVGNTNGYCTQPVYNSGYVVYPVSDPRYRPPVVVAPVNTGYYNNGYYVNNGYYNNGYYNPGYNPGYGHQGHHHHKPKKKNRCR